MRLEHLLQSLFGNPGAVIVDMQHERVRVVFNHQVRVLAVFERIVDQVAHAPAQGQGLARKGPRRPPGHSHAAITVGQQIRLD